MSRTVGHKKDAVRSACCSRSVTRTEITVRRDELLDGVVYLAYRSAPRQRPVWTAAWGQDGVAWSWLPGRSTTLGHRVHAVRTAVVESIGAFVRALDPRLRYNHAYEPGHRASLIMCSDYRGDDLCRLRYSSAIEYVTCPDCLAALADRLATAHERAGPAISLTAEIKRGSQ